MPALSRRLQDVLDELVGTGAETGLQVAVHRRGERLVDAVAGVADGATGRPMTGDTPVFCFSAAKGMAALVAHLLVRDGLLGYDTPVADVWPEFGAHGKATATLRHVLTHTVGVPAMPGGLTPADLGDRDRVAAALAAAEPRWRPGSRTGYHSYTFGFLVGEIARRTTGRTMGELLDDRVAVPLGIAGELYFGVPAAELPRLARLADAEPPEPAPVEPAPVPGAVLAPWESRPSAAMGNDPAILQADVPSVGTFTARGIATAYAAMLDGRLLDADRLRELSAPTFEGTDQVFGNPARLALGYPLGRLGTDPDVTSTTFGWPGGGGSYAYADVATGTSFALTKNRLTPSFAAAQRCADLVAAVLGPPS